MEGGKRMSRFDRFWLKNGHDILGLISFTILVGIILWNLPIWLGA